MELQLLRPMPGRGATGRSCSSSHRGRLHHPVWNSDHCQCEQRIFPLDAITSYAFLDLRLGRVLAFVGLIGIGVVVATGLLLSRTSFGRQVRALAGNPRLAEVAGSTQAP